MKRIELQQSQTLGTAKIDYLINEEDYEYAGMCSGMAVYSTPFDKSFTEIEVLDLSTTRRNKTRRIMQITLTYTKRGSYTVEMVSIDRKYQGHGIAPRIYRYIMRKFGIVLEAGSQQSPGGRSVWAALSKMTRITMHAIDSKFNFYDVEAIDGELISDDIDVYNGRKVVRVLAKYI